MFGINKIYYNGYKEGIEKTIEGVTADAISGLIKWIKEEKPALKFNPGFITNFLLKN